MAGDDDLDLYRSGVDRAAVVRGILRALGVLLGLVVAAFALTLFALRCFDSCPSDPSLNRVWQLLPAALLLLGLVIVVEAAFFRTRWAGPATAAVAVAGALIALFGIVSLALVPSIDDPGRNEGTAAVAVVAAVVGGAIAFLRRPRAPR